MIYFTSDLHFGHSNVIKYCKRPFMSSDEMDAALEANWNNTIQARDEIYILGDITLRGPEYVNALLARLNGKKHLISGNHDVFKGKQSFDTSLLESIQPYLEIKHDKRRVVMCHYPILSWNGRHKSSVHLHGHIHATSKYNLDNSSNGIYRFDVGVDANAYHPVSIYTIMALASTAPCLAVDHHYRGE